MNRLDLISPRIALFIGAFLVLLGYGLSVYQRNKETTTKRQELLATLRVELNSIGSEVPSYDVGKVIYRDPIHLPTVATLLGGETLHYKTHSTLIQSLRNLQVAVSKYNDLVHTTNLAQSIAPISDNAHAQIYQNIVRYHQELQKARGEVSRQLPP